MNTSSHVDVIIASPEFRADFDEPVADALDEIGKVSRMEHADVAPDPDRRFIVLAPTKALGSAHAESVGIDPVAIVTPRSMHGARGLVVDEIIEAPGLTTEERAALMAETFPALTTSGAE